MGYDEPERKEIEIEIEKKGKRSYHRNLERGPAGNRKKMVSCFTLRQSRVGGE